MKDDTIIGLLLVIGCAFILGAIVLTHQHFSGKCETAGGVLVRTTFGWECAKGVEW